MDDEKKDWKNYISNERITRSFTMHMETFGKVKQFIEKYDRRNFSQAIDDLVNIGLASVGYRTNEEIMNRFKGYNNFNYNTVDIPISELSSMDIIATGITHSQHDRMRMIMDVIQRLCNESKDSLALRVDIIRESEIEGLESSEIEDALDRLKRNGQIYEPIHAKYKIQDL